MQNRHQPHFRLAPLQNARTAYQPVWLPTILVVPHRIPRNGTNIKNSEIFDLILRIEEAPGKVPVAGYQYRGIFVPDFERFRRIVDPSEYANFIINLEGLQFTRNGQNITFEEAEEGDYFTYYTTNGQIESKYPYYPDAVYYDLSPITIDTHDLKPLGKYVISWCAHYYRRIITSNDQLYCINDNSKSLARLAIVWDHPGDIHQTLIEGIPSVYFEGKRFDQDETVKFVRPFADAMQDVFDEAAFINGINHLNKIPAQLISYLSYLLGWDLPYFPGSTDNLRRRVLKNARRIQELKGSKRSIIDLFELFGYLIEIINLWYRKDGKALIAPNEKQIEEFENQEITSITHCRTEALLYNYSGEGFVEFTIPLLKRPISDMTIEAWITTEGDTAHKNLINITEDYETELCSTDNDGYTNSNLPKQHTIGYSKVLLDNQLGTGIKSQSEKQSILTHQNIRYNRNRNYLSIKLDKNLTSKEIIFIHVTYRYQKIDIPEDLEDLRSNRFDIEILEKANGKQVDPQVLEFLIDFIFKLKPFHSLLRKIKFTSNIDEVYAVTDFCIGGDIAQRPGTDLGEVQVPPAIIPTDPSLCDDEFADRGFKEEDLEYRSRVLSGLEQEFQAWRDIDEKYGADQDTCSFTENGQDRKYDDGTKACDLINDQDYCYIGRVNGELEILNTLKLQEKVTCHPCELTLGSGIYYTLDYNKKDWCSNIPCTIDPNNPESINRSFLEGLLAKAVAFDKPTLRFTDKNYLEDEHLDNFAYHAIQRPSLNIIKDNLNIPGHRSPTMSNLISDYTHNDYELRPWDLDGICPDERRPDLNESVITLENGDESIYYDTYPLIYYGNGIQSDIVNLDGQVSDPKFVTHKIYYSGPRGHESLTLDAISYTSDLVSGGDTAPTAICIPDTIGNIFTSSIITDKQAADEVIFYNTTLWIELLLGLI